MNRQPNVANNLNMLRMVAALLVLLGHAYIFKGQKDFLILGTTPLGPLGVYIFFSISGYLIVQSWSRDPNVGRFLIRRCLRIFPGLLVCTLLTVFVLGPLVSKNSLSQYFSSPETYLYLRNIFLYIGYRLPGVFEQNIYPYAVNGSLWSLPVEFFMYLIVCFAGFLVNTRLLTVALTLICLIGNIFFLYVPENRTVTYAVELRQLFVCGSFFWIGALICSFQLERYIDRSLVCGLFFLCLLAANLSFGAVYTCLAITVPVASLAFGLDHSVFLGKLTQTGDYSYGIYIYAFPVQQTISYLFPSLSLVEFNCFSAVATLALAIPSWHFVENVALSFKPNSRNT
jgi:peptidoglycan/LPS O-acetylase OafA/YrhL